MKKSFYIIFLVLIFVSCTKKETEHDLLKLHDEYSYNYDSIVSMIVSDSTNIFIISTEKDRIKKTSQIYILDTTLTWKKNRFTIKFIDKLLYKLLPESQETNPYKRSYIFKDNFENIISNSEKKELEFISQNLKRDIITNIETKNIILSHGKIFNSIVIGLSKPIISKDKMFMFVDYNIYLNPYGKETMISRDLYSTNCIIFKKNNREGWDKYKHVKWLIL